MFKHKGRMPAGDEQPALAKAEEAAAPAKPTVEEKIHGRSTGPRGDTSLDTVRELLEKNLKWSQIIYEQNRRINSKLFWTAFASWFKILLFIAVLAVSVFLLSPLVQQVINAYSAILGGGNSAQATEPSSAANLEQLFNLLPLNDGQRAQLKELFNKR